MTSLRSMWAKLRYPQPELGDFSDELPLDKMTVNDGDDRVAKLPEPEPQEKPKRGKKK